MYTSFLNNLELIVLELDLGPRELLELSHGSGSYWCPWAGKQPWIKGARLPANSVDWNRKRLIMGSGGSLINLLSLGQPARARLHFVCSMQKGQAGAQEGECSRWRAWASRAPSRNFPRRPARGQAKRLTHAGGEKQSGLLSAQRSLFFKIHFNLVISRMALTLSRTST